MSSQNVDWTFCIDPLHSQGITTRPPVPVTGPHACGGCLALRTFDVTRAATTAAVRVTLDYFKKHGHRLTAYAVSLERLEGTRGFAMCLALFTAPTARIALDTRQRYDRRAFDLHRAAIEAPGSPVLARVLDALADKIAAAEMPHA